MRRKSLFWTSREAKKVRLGSLRNIRDKAGFDQRDSGQRRESLGAGLGSTGLAKVIKRNAILRAAHDFIVIGPKIREADTAIDRRSRRD